MLQQHQDGTAGLGYRCKCISRLVIVIVTGWCKKKKKEKKKKEKEKNPITPFRAVDFLSLSFLLSVLPTRLWWMAKGESSFFSVLPTIFSCDNHILTVQMRKWLIGPVINIMSYYPGQRNYFIKLGYIYLCSPMHLFRSLHNVLLRVRLRRFSICGSMLISCEYWQCDWLEIVSFCREKCIFMSAGAQHEILYIINFTEQHFVTRSSDR